MWTRERICLEKVGANNNLFICTILYIYMTVSRHSSVGIVTRLYARLDDQRIVDQTDFRQLLGPSFTPEHLVGLLRSSQPPIQWISGDLFPAWRRGGFLTLIVNLHLVPWLRISGAKLYLSSPVNQWRAQVAIYTYINTQIYVYIYVCVCACAHACL